MPSGIDVIIPVYNGEKYIKEAIESVLNQTLLPDNIFVVNDGSTDRTQEIIDGYKKFSVPVICINKKNGGLSSARNAGIKASKNKFVAFLDADDIWLPNKLAKQIEVFNITCDNKLGVVYSDFTNINEKGEIIEKYDDFQFDKTWRGEIFEKLIIKNKVAGSGSAVLVKKECFEKVGLFDENLKAAEDWDMWLRIAQKFTFDYIYEPLVKLRRHSDSMQSDRFRMHLAYIDFFNKWIEHDEINSDILKFWKAEYVSSIIWKTLFSKNCRDYYLKLNNQMNAKVKQWFWSNKLFILYSIFKKATKKICRH